MNKANETSFNMEILERSIAKYRKYYQIGFIVYALIIILDFFLMFLRYRSISEDPNYFYFLLLFLVVFFFLGIISPIKYASRYYILNMKKSAITVLLDMKIDSLYYNKDFIVAREGNIYIFSKMTSSSYYFMKFYSPFRNVSSEIIIPKFSILGSNKKPFNNFIYQKMISYCSIPIDGDNFISGDATITRYIAPEDTNKRNPFSPEKLENFFYDMVYITSHNLKEESNESLIIKKLNEIKSMLVTEKESKEKDFLSVREETLSKELMQIVIKGKCIICLKSNEERQSSLLICSKCGKGGHRDHILEWMEKQFTRCPVCRQGNTLSTMLEINL